GDRVSTSPDGVLGSEHREHPTAAPGAPSQLESSGAQQTPQMSQSWVPLHPEQLRAAAISTLLLLLDLGNSSSSSVVAVVVFVFISSNFSVVTTIIRMTIVIIRNIIKLASKQQGRPLDQFLDLLGFLSLLLGGGGRLPILLAKH